MVQTTRTRGTTTNAARICTILAFVFAVGALLVSPLIFGLAAVVLGVVGAYLGDRPLGWYAAAAGAAGALLGILLNAIILNS
ncbi:hypothetical protein OHA21_09145 [Actinoplanes sp. NBC_00393]|uniref:hypothetical protein n=1 Tax=Actinoplanes sp. NBC_00393 TaxID=2975953 RepID=UPI002E2326E9